MPDVSTSFGNRYAAFDYNTMSSPHFYSPTVVGAAEPTTVSTIVIGTDPNATINFDASAQSVIYYTASAGANWTINFRGSGGMSLNGYMAIGDTLTLVTMTTQGATAYYNSAYQIDGTAVTPKWQGGTAPTAGNASGIDVYTYTITKTANATYNVLASISQFK